MLENSSFRQGIRDSALIILAVAFFGTAYGVLAVSAGFSPWLAIFSSVVIVSGAAQFAMIGLLAAGPVPVLLAVTGLGLRHLPMSAALAGIIGPRPLGTRLRLSFILVDETFGLTVRAANAGVEHVVAYKTAADLMLYTGFVGGTVIGATLGAAIDPEAVGIGVLFPLLFLGLAAPMIHGRRDWLVAGSAVLASIAATLLLPSAWQVTVAAVAASAVGMAFGE
ncbi:MAG TPA: AzlC family ABC transporter permease [Acidimicrobiia bacterium]|nr:AzlC family ABC transporter permease [Acidimicrobiia bacterium]